MKQKFNAKLLAKDINSKLKKDGVSLRQVAKATKDKVTISTLQRLSDESQEPKASTLGDVCNWLEKPIATYF